MVRVLTASESSLLAQQPAPIESNAVDFARIATLLAQRLSLRAEGRYTMFDEVTTNQYRTAPNIFTDTMTADVLTARLAITYRFTRDEPHAHLK